MKMHAHVSFSLFVLVLILHYYTLHYVVHYVDAMGIKEAILEPDTHARCDIVITQSFFAAFIVVVLFQRLIDGLGHRVKCYWDWVFNTTRCGLARSPITHDVFTATAWGALAGAIIHFLAPIYSWRLSLALGIVAGSWGHLLLDLVTGRGIYVAGQRVGILHLRWDTKWAIAVSLLSVAGFFYYAYQYLIVDYPKLLYYLVLKYNACQGIPTIVPVISIH